MGRTGTVALALVGLSIVRLAVLRRGIVVRLIRSIDRRGGLFSPRAASAYAAGAPRLFRGLYRRAADDIVAAIGDRAATIVDVGSGPGDLVRELAGRLPAARIVGVEPADAMREIAVAGGGVFVAGSAEALPFPDASLDLVVSTLSAHHWPDPTSALRELDRVLRPGGEARIYDVRFAAYSPAELGRFAAAAGLEPGRISRMVLPGRLIRPFVLIRLSA